ncbi:MAG: toll/interleukin-1 receptor domain-containing protein [Chloroflexota bacterium]
MGHIFVSYSHKDTEYAHALADSLQSMSFTVWIDARLDYGSQWPHEIQKQLDACDAFILIMSPRSFASEWVQSELQRAKRKLKPIFPLLLEGDEPWLSVESTQYYDVRNRKLPDDEFYADLARAVPAKEMTQIVSPGQGSAKKTEPVKNIQPRSKSVGIFALLGILAVVIGVCIVTVVLLLQRVADSKSLSPVPTGPDIITAQPTFLENIIPPAALTLTSVSSLPTETAAVPLPVELPDGPNVIMFAPWGDKCQFTILSAQREPLLPDKHLLRLRIRAWTESAGGMNFWSDSFRLIVGDQRITPVNNLNELVKRDETVDGDVEFEIDASVKDSVLVITVGRDAWATKELRLIFP